MSGDTIYLPNYELPLYRIVAEQDIYDEQGELIVPIGEKGGYIDDEKRLDELDNSWINKNSIVYGEASLVTSNSLIIDSKINNSLIIHSIVNKSTVKNTVLLRQGIYDGKLDLIF